LICFLCLSFAFLLIFGSFTFRNVLSSPSDFQKPFTYPSRDARPGIRLYRLPPVHTAAFGYLATMGSPFSVVYGQTTVDADLASFDFIEERDSHVGRQRGIYLVIRAPVGSHSITPVNRCIASCKFQWTSCGETFSHCPSYRLVTSLLGANCPSHWNPPTSPDVQEIFRMNSH
jgi:hypothetical protein